MAFKMSKPSMINISYNRENSGVSPLHKETDPKSKKNKSIKDAASDIAKNAVKGAVGGVLGATINAVSNVRNKMKQKAPKQEPTTKPPTGKDIIKEKIVRQKTKAAKRKLKADGSTAKAKTVSAIKSKDVVNKGKMSLLDEPKASTLKTTKDKKKKTISGAEAIKKARKMRSNKKKNKKSSSKDKRKQERADKIMSKL